MEAPQLISLQDIQNNIVNNCQDVLHNTTLLMNANHNALLKLETISSLVMEIAKIRANEIKPESQEEYEEDEIVKLCKQVLQTI